MMTETQRLLNIARADAYQASDAYQYDLAEEMGYSRDAEGVAKVRRAEEEEALAVERAKPRSLDAIDRAEAIASAACRKLGIAGREVVIRGNYSNPALIRPTQWKACRPLPESAGASLAVVIRLADGRYIYGTDAGHAADITDRMGS